MDNLTEYIIGVVLLMIAVGVSMAASDKLERTRKSRLPQTQPYQWGYFIGCLSFWFAPATLGLSALLGWGIIKRRRWAWVVGTILTLNPFVWLINGIYAGRRWHEFGQEAAGSKDGVASIRVVGNPFRAVQTILLAGILVSLAVLVIQNLNRRSGSLLASTSRVSDSVTAAGAIPAQQTAPSVATEPTAAPDSSGAGRNPFTATDTTSSPNVWGTVPIDEALIPKAEKGDLDAQLNLGLDEEMFTVHTNEGIAWIRKAANAGYAPAQLQLGSFYYRGGGLHEDHVEGAIWTRKAAEQGYAEAQSQLGMSYFQGDGVTQDDVEAYKWISLAEAQGYKRREVSLSSLESIMTPEQIARGQQMVRDFKSLTQPPTQ